jgi:hypothetical protein
VFFVLRGRLWTVFLEQGLEKNQNDEGQQENKKKPALGAWFLLRILIFGQSSITVLNFFCTCCSRRMLRDSPTPNAFPPPGAPRDRSRCRKKDDTA